MTQDEYEAKFEKLKRSLIAQQTLLSTVLKILIDSGTIDKDKLIEKLKENELMKG